MFQVGENPIEDMTPPLNRDEASEEVTQPCSCGSGVGYQECHGESLHNSLREEMERSDPPLDSSSA